MLLAAIGRKLINGAGDRRGSGLDRLDTICRRTLEATVE
jgi:hypothetical protein